MTGLITRGDATLVFNGVDTAKESLLDLIKLMSSNHHNSLELVDWSVSPHPCLVPCQPANCRPTRIAHTHALHPRVTGGGGGIFWEADKTRLG